MTSGYIGSPQGNVIIPVSQVCKQTKEIDISAAVTSSAGSVSTKTVTAVFYKDSTGATTNWRMSFNLEITYTDDVDLSGSAAKWLVMSLGSNLDECTASIFALSKGTAPQLLQVQTGTDKIYFYTASTTVKYLKMSGTIGIAGEPTTYTTAANMEGAPNVAAYIPSASATSAGLVDTAAAQTFAGVKTFNANPVMAGGGVQFPATQVASTDVNCLDDYQEGTWTPVITTDSGGHTIAYTNRGGTYRKIGGVVICWFYAKITVSVAAGAATGLTKTCLPFSPKSDNLTDSIYTRGGVLTSAPNVGHGTVIRLNSDNPSTSDTWYFHSVAGTGRQIEAGTYGGYLIYDVD